MRTVRMIVPVVLLLSIIVCTGIFVNKMLIKTSNHITSHITQIESSTKTGDWNKAADELAYMEKYWSKTKKTWTILLDHMEIDNIDTAISRMGKFIESKDRSMTLGEAAALMQYVNHIPDKEAFSLNNIL